MPESTQPGVIRLLASDDVKLNAFYWAEAVCLCDTKGIARAFETLQADVCEAVGNPDIKVRPMLLAIEPYDTPGVNSPIVRAEVWLHTTLYDGETTHKLGWVVDPETVSTAA